MSWSPVSKPATSSWTEDNTALGKEMYDDPRHDYDQDHVYYDGYNPNAWTPVTKPTTANWTNITKPS